MKKKRSSKVIDKLIASLKKAKGSERTQKTALAAAFKKKRGQEK